MILDSGLDFMFQTKPTSPIPGLVRRNDERLDVSLHYNEVDVFFNWMAVAMIVAFGATALLVKQFCMPNSVFHLLDHPNDRSLHTQPTPRSGGVAIVIGILLAFPFWILAVGSVPQFMIWLSLAALLIAVLAFLDDRFSVTVGIRIIGHIIAAGLLVFGTGLLFNVSLPGIDLKLYSWLAIPVTILFLVWMTNLYNFMDGMDGFAGGMSVIGFMTLALFGGFAGDLIFMTMNLLIAAAAAGFLVFNFPPARIFMGDTGSATLGFIAGCILLWADNASILPLWIGVVVFSPFIIDATVTLLRRGLRRERIWQAHKTHYYQRLVQLGWGHRKTVLAEYVLMLLCSIAALVALNSSTQTQISIFFTLLVVYAAFFNTVARLEQRHDMHK
jgi:UDP-N-acetylmuramyl pentapeptide phosphotransferase/UDP-N-acetylglucosamine-1-phosphate transferase